MSGTEDPSETEPAVGTPQRVAVRDEAQGATHRLMRTMPVWSKMGWFWATQSQSTY
jgi:hypothetical protein